MQKRFPRLLMWSLAALLLLAGAAAWLQSALHIGNWSMVLNAVSGKAGPPASNASVGQHLVARKGFTVALYAARVEQARMLRMTAAGDLLASQPGLGQITLLARDADGNGLPDAQRVLIDGLDRPHGIDIHDGWLYIAEGGAVGRVRFDANSGHTEGEYRRIVSGIPAGGNHWRRTLRVGADGWIYLNVGSSCNVCEEEHPWRATMLRFRPDGSDLQVHASGLRNSSGFDFAPWDGALYATDHGRDLLGDDYPPCELNRIVGGGFYGWPYANGFGDPDPDFGTGHEDKVAATLKPEHGFRAHNAPLGIAFLREDSLVAEFGRAALVALHGSWNRSVPDGYKVVLLQWDAGGKIVESDFLTGFEREGTVIGRPVDVLDAGDGTLFVSDDYAGAIYRISRGEPQPAIAAPAAATAGATADPLAGIATAEIAAAHIAGEALLKRYACIGCHAPGTAPGDKLLSLGERYDVERLAAFFLAPSAAMPVFPLDANDRRSLAIHLLARAREAGAETP